MNSAPGAQPLRFAEEDAGEFAEVFAGGLAHADTTTRVILGPKMTIQRFSIALALLAQDPPEHLILFFSGHGGPGGILLADGVFPHQALAAFLRHVRSRGPDEAPTPQKERA